MWSAVVVMDWIGSLRDEAISIIWLENLTWSVARRSAVVLIAWIAGCTSFVDLVSSSALVVMDCDVVLRDVVMSLSFFVFSA